MRHDFRQRIYQLKVTIVALVSLGIGVGLQFVARYVANRHNAGWLSMLPISDIGGTLFAAGLFGIVWDYFDGRDREERETERLTRVLEDSAPAIRDAVVRGFALESEDLKRVATPELLDDIATNALALRLKDRTFAAEVYADVRDQAVRAPERWHDVHASIRLSSIDERNTSGVPQFLVTVRWEYSVVPSHSIQRFACVSDRDEYHELIEQVPATVSWFMTPRPGFVASSRDAFELVRYTVAGADRPIRRSERKTGQTYSVTIGEDAVREGKTVQISYVYKTITPQSGHLLYFDVEQPTRNISVDFDYNDTDISHVSVLDLVASSKTTRVQQLPASVQNKSINVDFTGWVFPRTGFAFVWTLANEVHEGARPDAKPRETQAR